MKLAKAHPRNRRLQAGGGEALLAACGPHLRACVEAALETGMRRGEILSLQWRQVEGMDIEGTKVTWAPRATMFLPYQKTKTNRVVASRFPRGSRAFWKCAASTRQASRTRSTGLSSARRPAVRSRTRTGLAPRNLAGAWPPGHLYCRRQPLARATTGVAGDRAAFHDLRREAGSRWMDAGVPIATIQRWLGHANVSQTSTYLAGTATSEHEAMRRFEEHREAPATGLQRGAEQGGTNGAQTAAGRDERPSENAVGRGSAIM